MMAEPNEKNWTLAELDDSISKLMNTPVYP